MHSVLLLSLALGASAIPTPQSLSDVSNVPEDIIKVAPAVAAFPGTVLVGLPNQILDMADAKQAAHALYSSIADKTISESDVAPAISKIYAAIKPTYTPTSISDAKDRVASVLGLAEGVSVQATQQAKTSEDFFTNVLGLVLNGFCPADIENDISAFVSNQVSHIRPLKMETNFEPESWRRQQPHERQSGST